MFYLFHAWSVSFDRIEIEKNSLDLFKKTMKNYLFLNMFLSIFKKTNLNEASPTHLLLARCTMHFHPSFES